MDTEIWNSQLEDKLIDMWEEQECLYKVSANSYRDRDKKKKAIRQLMKLRRHLVFPVCYMQICLSANWKI